MYLSTYFVGVKPSKRVSTNVGGDNIHCLFYKISISLSLTTPLSLYRYSQTIFMCQYVYLRTIFGIGLHLSGISESSCQVSSCLIKLITYISRTVNCMMVMCIFLKELD